MVLKRTVKIGAKNYVPVECYQAVANAMGCVGSARDVKRVEGGYTAIGEVKRLSDGVIVSEGEGFVGDDEPKWAKGPEYARRSMVQTRAIGRACRAAFAFVVPMIDAGLSTTPAEEMDGINGAGSIDPPPPVVRGNAAVRNALRPSPPQSVGAAAQRVAEEPPPLDDSYAPPSRRTVDAPPHIPTAPPVHDRNMKVPFGKNKDKIIGDPSVPEADLKYLENAFLRDLADAGKAKFHDRTRTQLANVRGELAYRGVA